MARKMKDVPMLLSDRELLSEEFEGFDEMTVEDLRVVMEAKVNMLCDLIQAIRTIAIEKEGE
jgi:hypothetical protein